MDRIISETVKAAQELTAAAGLKAGQIVVVGCSSSEIAGHNLGTASNADLGKVVFDALYSVFSKQGIYIAAQCCEHLNRAIIIEREAVKDKEIVSVIPQPKAGGSFATAAYSSFNDPVAVEDISADAGLDIGGTLIGMHLKKVAVPLRLSVRYIGKAPVSAARTRPKFIGGCRAVYDQNLL